MRTIYTLHTNTHKKMYDDYFKPSLRKLYTKDQLNIRVVKIDENMGQGGGSFRTEGWINTLYIKCDLFLQALNENKNDWFIFADCDVQFFRPFVDDIGSALGDNDIVCQSDRGSMCAGLLACKSNDTMFKAFKLIKETYWKFENDQLALNYYKNMFKYNLLDENKYYTIGNCFTNIDGTNIWDNVTNIKPPTEKILLHHANYVIGVDNKIKLMEVVKTNYNAK